MVGPGQRAQRLAPQTPSWLGDMQPVPAGHTQRRVWPLGHLGHTAGVIEHTVKQKTRQVSDETLTNSPLLLGMLHWLPEVGPGGRTLG